MSEKTSKNNFQTFSHKILDYVNKGVPRIDFLNNILEMLLEFSRCDTVELLLKENSKLMNHERGRIFRRSKERNKSFKRTMFQL